MAHEDILAVLQKEFPNGHPDVIPDFMHLMALHDSKNYDYAHGGDPLGNFDRVSAILNLYPSLKPTPPVVAVNYSLKQIDAILHAYDVGYDPKVESLDKRFDDVVVYWELAKILNKRIAQQGGK